MASRAHSVLLRAASKVQPALAHGTVVVVTVGWLTVLTVVVVVLAQLVLVPVVNSYAPMSQRPPLGCGRGVPRWSTDGGGQLMLPASMAGLPGKRASVIVGPQLSCSGPSIGSVSVRSLGSTRPQLFPLSRLWSSATMVREPVQFWLEGLPAKIVSRIVQPPTFPSSQ